MYHTVIVDDKRDKSIKKGYIIMEHCQLGDGWDFLNKKLPDKKDIDKMG
jgi:hypothetical protein